MIHDILYKTLIDPKPLRIKFDKIDKFIRTYNGTRYLTLFGCEKCDVICIRIRCLIGLKSSFTYGFFHYYTKIKVYSYDCSLLIEKRLTLHNVITLIKSVLNKNKNH